MIKREKNMIIIEFAVPDYVFEHWDDYHKKECKKIFKDIGKENIHIENLLTTVLMVSTFKNPHIKKEVSDFLINILGKEALQEERKNDDKA